MNVIRRIVLRVLYLGMERDMGSFATQPEKRERQQNLASSFSQTTTLQDPPKLALTGRVTGRPTCKSATLDCLPMKKR